jgi:phosphonate transport system substrate-binding protein
MVRLGGTATDSHLAAFRGLETHFKRLGIDLDWVLYSDDEAVVDAFVAGEIDMAWNGPLNYVKIKNQLADPCRVVAMRDVDFDFITHFITQPSSNILTIEDLIGKRFAFGSRGSVEAGLLAHYFLNQSGINPGRDLGTCTFFEERQSSTSFDQMDVIEQVLSGEYDAGAVSGRTLSTLVERGTVPADAVRVFWSSPGYSHCCFTAQGDMEPRLFQQLEEAFVSVDGGNPEGKAIFEAEACDSLQPGISEGWELLEKAAQEQGLL